MQVINYQCNSLDIYECSFPMSKKTDTKSQVARYAPISNENLNLIRHFFLVYVRVFFLVSRLVDIRPETPLPPPLSPSVDIKLEYLRNSSPSPPSTISQSESLNCNESSTSLFRNSTRDSLKSTASSDRAQLMSGSEQSSVVQPLLTDLYQISMAYAYWKSNKHHEMATFDLYFRKNRRFSV